MTMHPDPWPPRHANRLGIRIAQVTPKPRHMEKLYRDTIPLPDEPAETRGAMVVAALAGWAVIVLVVAVILVLA